MKRKIVSAAVAISAAILLVSCDSAKTADLVSTLEEATQGVQEEEAEPVTQEEGGSVTMNVAPITQDGGDAQEPAPEAAQPQKEESKEEENASGGSPGYKYNEDGKRIVDLILFMGQSNMSGAGGNAKYAPKVPYEEGFEFRAISDPTRLYQITEPFGVNENNLNAIMDLPGAKRGSLVSSFANTYFEKTGVPVVAVSASAGATDTAFWMTPAVSADYTERLKRAIVWLENDKYEIRNKYVVWLQGESDAVDDLSAETYEENMNNIIRPLFIEGIQKVFFITPGRTITKKDYFSQIISAQIKMSKDSGYYVLGTTVLSGVSTEYMVDEWHYNQTVLNLVGKECAQSVAYYSNTGREACLYNYRNGDTYIPDGNDYDDDIRVEPLDLNNCGLKTDLE